MAKQQGTLWPLLPRTGAKHKILRAYLRAWIAIVGQTFQKVTIIDGFAGPGEYIGGHDGSPVIIYKEVMAALTALSNQISENLRVNLWFVEDDSKRHRHLRDRINTLGLGSSMVVVNDPICSSFESAIDGLLAKVGADEPLFVFVDPFGPADFSMDHLCSILRRKSAEVFLLLDVDGMDRMIRTRDQQNLTIIRSLLDLSETQAAGIAALEPQRKRIAAMREAFLGALNGRKAAQFRLAFRMLGNKLDPVHDMIFLTNNPRGFVKMKEAMWEADKTGEFRFSDAEVDQLGLELSSPEKRLWELIWTKFRGHRVTGKELREFVDLQTLYLSKHKKLALETHEPENLFENWPGLGIENRPKSGYPDDCVITFPK